MTKLNKSLSPLSVLFLAIGCIIGWGAFIMPATTFLPQAGPLGTTIGLLISAVMMTVIAINYSFMINLFPVSGGAFKYTKEVLGDNHAFICGWFLTLSYLTIVPLNATALALVSRSLFDNILSIGFSYTIAGYTIYAGELAISLLVLVIFARLNIRGARSSSIIQNIIVFSLVASILILFTSATLNQINTPNINPIFSPKTDPIYGIFAIISIAPWAFIGFDTIPQVASEFNFSPIKAKLLLIFSIFFGAFMYGALCLITITGVSNNYENWFEYISISNELKGIPSLPTFYAAYNLMGDIGLFFISFAVIAAILSGIMGFYIASSRLLHSIAENKMLPQRFSELHPNHQTPKNAILLVMVVSLIAPFFGRSVLLWVVDMSSIGATIAFMYTSYISFKMAKERNITFICWTGVLGIIFSCIFLCILLIPINGKSLLSIQSYIGLFIWSVLGLLMYAYTKLKSNKGGIIS